VLLAYNVDNNMKNKKYHTVETVQKFNRKIPERGQTDAPFKTHIYMTAHCPGLVLTLQQKGGGAKLVLWA
jgi:hypothetical protein